MLEFCELKYSIVEKFTQKSQNKYRRLIMSHSLQLYSKKRTQKHIDTHPEFYTIHIPKASNYYL